MSLESIRDRFGRRQVLTLLGFAAFWTWTDTNVYGQALSEAIGGAPVRPEALQLIGLAASAIISLLVLACPDRATRFVAGRRTAVATPLLAGIATAAYALISALGDGALSDAAATSLLAIAALAMSVSMFTFAFAAAFDPNAASPAGIVAGSIALAGLAQYGVTLAPPPIRIPLIVLLPLAAAAIAWRLAQAGELNPAEAEATRSEGAQAGASQPEHERVGIGEPDVPAGLLGLGKIGISTRFVVGLVVFSLAAGLIQFFYATNDPAVAAMEAQLRLVPRSVVALIVFLGLVVFSWKPYAIYRVGALATIASFVALPYLPDGWHAAAPLVTNAGYTCLELIAWILCFEAARLKPDRDLRALGLCRLAMAAAAFVGVALTSLLGALDAGPNLAGAVSSAATLALTLAMVLVLDEGWTSSTWYLLESASRQTSTTDALSQSCSALAQRAGLTAREEQVCSYLALGRSARYIAAELGIAVSTVNFHVRHVYEKLGVSSKQELIEMVENQPCA